MGLSAKDILASDPEYMQRQLYQQEMQRLNPTGGAAGALGALLGRGLGNVSSGRGFFDIADPALQRVSSIQSVFNDAMKTFDPENPAASYESMARQFSAMGFGQGALMASQEAAKARQLQSQEERSKTELKIRERQLMLEEVNKDPYGSITRALALPENDPIRQTILAGASARIGEKNRDDYIKELQIQKAKKDIEEKEAGQVSETVTTEAGEQLTKRGGKYYTADGKVYKGKIKKLPGASPLDVLSTLPGGMPATPGASPRGTPTYNPQTGKIEYK